MSLIELRVEGDRTVVAIIRGMTARVHSALYQVISSLTYELASRVQREKLQGQVLAHRTGKLSRSITPEVTDGEELITGRVYANSTAPYAAIHEYGFSGTEDVRGYDRRQTHVFGRPLDPPMNVHVGPFTRSMNMPERSFLRSTFGEMEPQIERDIQNAVLTAAQGEGL